MSRRPSYRRWVPTSPDPSERELQVLLGISDGLINAAIGNRIGVAEDTVKTYAARLFVRTKAIGRDHAVRIGFEREWLAVPDARPEPVELHDRELQLLQLISQGLSYKRIGTRTGTTEQYAKHLAQPMFRELDARNRAHAVRRGFEHGLLWHGGDAS
jgi:DNA-binding CsgD family transcriptional regulator